MKKLVCYLFITLFVFHSASADDFVLFIKESMVNKAIGTRKVWEWKDEKQGVYIKLKDLNLKLKDGYILGTANLDQFEQTNKTKANVFNPMDQLLKRAANMKDLASVQLIAQVGLTPDHKRVVLQNTKFTQFDNKYLPGFIEKSFLLGEINRKFAREIDGRTLYEFPNNMPIEISNLKINREAIEVYGNLLAPCKI